MIQIPRITKPDSGLYFRFPSWQVFHYEDGKTRLRSLGTADVEKARQLRDEHYAELRAAGATERDATRGPKPAKGGIYQYYQVRIGGHKMRSVRTLEEAEELRDWMLANPVKR